MTGDRATEWEHDGLGGRRIRRESDWDSQSSSWTLTETVRYVYDGDVILQERDGSNNPVNRVDPRGKNVLVKFSCGATFMSRLRTGTKPASLDGLSGLHRLLLGGLPRLSSLP